MTKLFDSTFVLRWREAGRRAATHSLVIWSPIMVGFGIVTAWRQHALAADFHEAYMPAAHAVLQGDSPYPQIAKDVLAQGWVFVYPPLIAFLCIPFTVLPTTARDLLAEVLSIACVVATLRLLNVRDWRCYLVVFLWRPTYAAIQLAQLTVPVGLGLALLWRWRARLLGGSTLGGLVVTSKLFLWPVFVWMLANRRHRLAAGSAIALSLLVFLPWAAIGFAGLADYPHLLRTLSDAQRPSSYSLPAVLAPIVPWRYGMIVGDLVGLAVLVAAVTAARRGDERVSFALTITASLALSPIIEYHYFVLLLVVIGLLQPRFGWAWALPVFLWVAPHGADTIWQTGLALAFVAASIAAALRSARAADGANRAFARARRGASGGVTAPAR